MTQEQALELCTKWFPDAELQLERTHCIGAKRGTMDQFKVWDWAGTGGKLELLADSEVSWEHCLDIVKSKFGSLYEPDTTPVEEEAL